MFRIEKTHEILTLPFKVKLSTWQIEQSLLFFCSFIFLRFCSCCFSEENIHFDPVQLLREVAIMTMMKHENLVRCFGAMTKKKNMCYIVTGN